MFGKPTANRLGIRRRIALSMSFGLFVAPRTTMRSEPDRRPSHNLEHSIELLTVIIWNQYARHEFRFHHARRLVIFLLSLS